MGPILGDSLPLNPRFPFHPRDDRVTSLTLHLSRAETEDTSVGVGMWWRLASVIPVPPLSVVTEAGSSAKLPPKPIMSDAELQQYHAAGSGLIYNDFSSSGASGHEYNVLHVAVCGWVGRSNTNVPKYFFADLVEAEAWLNSERGPEGINWRRCGICRPGPE